MGYMVFENFDNALLMSTSYKKVANPNIWSGGKVCVGGSDNFLHASDDGRIFQIDSSGVKLHGLLNPGGSLLSSFDVTYMEVVGN